MPRLGLRLTPHGRLLVEDQDDAPDIPEASSTRLNEAFKRGSGYGLVWLGVAGAGQALPPYLPGGATSRPAISAHFVCRHRTRNLTTLARCRTWLRRPRRSLPRSY